MEETKRKGIVWLFVAAGLLLAGLAMAFGLVTVYDGPLNSGVVVGGDVHNVGVEWRGAPGFFVNGQ